MFYLVVCQLQMLREKLYIFKTFPLYQTYNPVNKILTVQIAIKFHVK